MKNSCARILVVDDDSDERLLLVRAFCKAIGGCGKVQELTSGEDAIRYLAGEGAFRNREKYPFPSLILTDLAMPNGDGFSVLEFLQRNPGWSVIPRIVLSNSEDEDDIRTAFGLGATAYHQKPLSLAELQRFAQLVIHYWTTCHVPPVDLHGRIVKTQHARKLGSRFAVPPLRKGLERPKRD